VGRCRAERSSLSSPAGRRRPPVSRTHPIERGTRVSARRPLPRVHGEAPKAVEELDVRSVVTPVQARAWWGAVRAQGPVELTWSRSSRASTARQYGNTAIRPESGLKRCPCSAPTGTACRRMAGEGSVEGCDLGIEIFRAADRGTSTPTRSAPGGRGVCDPLRRAGDGQRLSRLRTARTARPRRTGSARREVISVQVRLPWSVTIGQVTPRQAGANPVDHPVDDLPIIHPRSAGDGPRYERSERIPLLVTESGSVHPTMTCREVVFVW
jgi:hypothetical protein